MSEVDGRFVKRGLWTNVDQGSVMGKTLTTDHTSGAIIIAVIAVLSTVGTSHLWSILLFAYHQLRADGAPSDGLFRQQQALLRTLLPPSSLMAESVKLWWSWRHKNNKVMLRSAALFLLATTCTVGFIAASICSSFVVNSSDLEVLVQSPSCGHVNYSLPLDAYRAQIAAIRSVSLPYAQECYRNQTILPARCKAFTHPSISFTSEKVPCPFDSNFCSMESGLQQAFAVDSGLVDLNRGFGLNLPRKDRVSYRRRTTCAVLPLAGYTTVLNATDFPESLRDNELLPGEQLMLFHYGERPALGAWKNVTTLSNLLVANLTRSLGLTQRPYLFPAQERGGVENSFVTLEGMRLEDADVAVIFNWNTIKYTKPVDDPWFHAQKTTTILDKTTGRNRTLYMSESSRRAMGCAIQHQLCIKTDIGDDCSQLDSLPVNITSENWPKASLVQLSALQLVVEANQNIGLTHATILQLAERVRNDGVMVTQVPSDQWINEVQGMESFVWASTQVLVTDYAIGPGLRTPDVSDWVIEPTEGGDKELCRTQKMRKAGGFVNVNVFGLVFVIAVSLFFTVVDIVLLRFLVFLDRPKQVLGPRMDRWIQDGVLQLQRRAYEAHGQGTWSDLNKEVPLTRFKDTLEELPFESLPLRKSPAASILPNGAHPSRLAPTQSTQSQAAQAQNPQSQSAQSYHVHPQATHYSPNSRVPSTISSSPQTSSIPTPVTSSVRRASLGHNSLGPTGQQPHTSQASSFIASASAQTQPQHAPYGGATNSTTSVGLGQVAAQP